MLVDLEMTPDGYVRVTAAEQAAGPVGGRSVLVGPGQWYRGWRFRRLRRLAPGRVDLRVPIDSGPAIGEDTDSWRRG